MVVSASHLSRKDGGEGGAPGFSAGRDEEIGAECSSLRWCGVTFVSLHSCRPASYWPLRILYGFSMSTLFRGVFTLAVLLLSFGLLTEAFHLMNLPSDRSLLGGIAMILGLTLAVPMVVHIIWSKLR